ncbi:Bug family tripartite tricarboxylate transporter substrate binding protein [Caenimonas aquaedulcis]|uniref:Tripartite tricarboxylate transporter substrate binding protein n=1 Tax=Caenimonas aquaedulcis TaxID=2793270 RepID=A0A931MIX4_9BURK|nr:tripartite tricarboxylate transporter substrate binding protein [Caenimonas aquaedulcis]MBG9390601.1 tripartite tricarboxylate transporter substrate binding protein [Caenimonas aquaedulcis]
MKFSLRAACTSLMLATAACSAAHAADRPYPERPVRLVVPTAAGGPTDYVARQLAQQLSTSLQQPVVVHNIPGASGVLGAAEVARDKPDGYTLLFTLNTPITLVPATGKKLGYDVKRDLVPLAHIASTPLVLYVGSALQINSFDQFVTRARQRKGSVSYGFPGTGSSFHILGEYLNKTLALDLVAVPYKGAAPMLNDLVGGQLSAGINDIGVTAPFVKSGKLRALAVTGERRSPAAPDIPTFGELGIAHVERLSPWWGVFARAGTPEQIVAKVSQEVVKAMNDPALRARLAESGYEVTGWGPVATARAIDEEMIRWREILSQLGDLKFE